MPAGWFPGRGFTQYLGRAVRAAGAACVELGELALPPACATCGVALGDGSSAGARAHLCPACRSRLKPLPWPRCSRCGVPTGTAPQPGPCLECRDWPDALESARSVSAHRPPASRLVHAFKYGGWQRLDRVLAARMAPLVRELGRSGRPSVLVPVPTSPHRVRQRGFDQAERLAFRIGEILRMDAVRVLHRRRGRGPQAALQGVERAANVRGAFTIGPCGPSPVRRSRIVLIDDVLTTGATVGEAATVLSAFGAHSIVAVTYTRTITDGGAGSG